MQASISLNFLCGGQKKNFKIKRGIGLNEMLMQFPGDIFKQIINSIEYANKPMAAIYRKA
jgi:hypothetical protein